MRDLKSIIKYHDSWRDFFEMPEIKQCTERIVSIYEDNIITEYKSKLGCYVFPRTLEDIFRFSKTDATNIKAVIVGMDPYPSFQVIDGEIIPEATGRSFEVRSLRKKDITSKFKQASLRNIMKCIYKLETGNTDTSIEHIRNEISENKYTSLKLGEWFDICEDNGVLFLNASLMYWFRFLDIDAKTGKERLDIYIPWNTFMRHLSSYLLKKNPYTKWMLFGNDAQKQFDYIEEKNKICTVHPRMQTFVEENPFQYKKELFIRKQKEVV